MFHPQRYNRLSACLATNIALVNGKKGKPHVKRKHVILMINWYYRLLYSILCYYTQRGGDVHSLYSTVHMLYRFTLTDFFVAALIQSYQRRLSSVISLCNCVALFEKLNVMQISMEAMWMLKYITEEERKKATLSVANCVTIGQSLVKRHRCCCSFHPVASFNSL